MYIYIYIYIYIYRLLRDALLCPAAKELPSRQVLVLLERVVRCSAEVGPDDALAEVGREPVGREPGLAGGGRPAALLGRADQEDPVPPFVFEPKLGGDNTSVDCVVQAFRQAVQQLCAMLESPDFRLMPSLAAGSSWASLEVLRAYRTMAANQGRMNFALQSVTSTVKSFFYEDEIP